MALTYTEQRALDQLVAKYAAGTNTEEERIQIVVLLAKRDDLLRADKGRPYIVCPLNLPVCEKVVWAENAQIDHKLPKSRGGRTVSSNLQATCAPCNASKGNG